jgi:hypothetical protein
VNFLGRIEKLAKMSYDRFAIKEIMSQTPLQRQKQKLSKPLIVTDVTTLTGRPIKIYILSSMLFKEIP